MEIADGLVVEMARQYVASVLKDDDTPVQDDVVEVEAEEASDNEEK